MVPGSFGLYDLHRLGSASGGQRLRWCFVWPGDHIDVRNWSISGGPLGDFFEHEAADPLVDCAAIAASNETTDDSRLSVRKFVRVLRKC